MLCWVVCDSLSRATEERLRNRAIRLPVLHVPAPQKESNLRTRPSSRRRRIPRSPWVHAVFKDPG
jgi:hypothetical protein